MLQQNLLLWIQMALPEFAAFTKVTWKGAVMYKYNHKEFQYKHKEAINKCMSLNYVHKHRTVGIHWIKTTLHASYHKNMLYMCWSPSSGWINYKSKRGHVYLYWINIYIYTFCHIHTCCEQTCQSMPLSKPLSAGGLAATKAKVISHPSAAPRPEVVKLATAVNCET